MSLLLFCSLGNALFGQEISAKPLVAPGGLITILPAIDYESVVSRANMIELRAQLPEPDHDLQNDPRFKPEVWAEQVRLVRDVWCLQFSFKPLRIIDVDIPSTEGYDRKKVWYLVYKVENLGPANLDEKRIQSALGSAVPPGNERSLPVPTDKTQNNVPRSAPLEIRQQTGIFAPHPGNAEAIRFEPLFLLATDRLVIKSEPVINLESGKTEWNTETTEVSYVDSVIPLALLKIKERERMAAFPETTVSIKDKTISPGEELWGVAMWTDIDPRINEFSIFVGGLTNAYQGWSDPNGEGCITLPRVLRLDWWRVGDAKSLNESQIHFGSKEGTMPTSVLDQAGWMPVEERERYLEALQNADANDDGWVSPAEKAIFHLKRQDWLKPTYGYEWVFF